MTIEQLANEYHAAIHAMENAAIAAEQEAQLTTPVSNLFTGLALQEGMGQLRLIRETPLGRTRPDFAVLLTRGGATMQRGYIELKAPSISVNPTLWVGRNRTQWERMSNEAEILVVCVRRQII
ncbi:hypothetical protein [Parasphingorhabdus halotolerans]|uniref:Uncharacterized protein n=1 Tax=Parasphingorhabdus halotolerans TaxID=2725558 RepID=A0A6H2DNV7_9SPHN|nr:hypothetical protein [Parasphingorhabdus halotolerans]QJB69878.1 hypothetical protein HF685_11795 [Parasphingorhabdus halotolerans]